MQDNNIMISYKIQDVKIIKTKIIDGEYHIYDIRNNKKPEKEYILKDYRTVTILLALYDKHHKLINIYKNRHQSTLKNILLDFKPSIVVTDIFKPFRNVINKTLPISKIVQISIM